MKCPWCGATIKLGEIVCSTVFYKEPLCEKCTMKFTGKTKEQIELYKQEEDYETEN